MKKALVFLLTMMLCVFSAVPVSAQNTLTVADGTGTNRTLPFFGEYADCDQHSQIIYPESMIAGLAGDTITSMTFYISQAYSTFFPNLLTVSLGISVASGLSTLNTVTELTQVYSGEIIIEDNLLIVEFETPFVYMGGNLLFDLMLSDGEYYSDTYFYGITSAGGGYMRLLYEGQVVAGVVNFIPKTTFTYTQPSCQMPQGVTASDITPNSATIFWANDPSALNYTLQYMPSSVSDWSQAEEVTTVTPLVELAGLAPATFYKVRVRKNCTQDDHGSWAPTLSFTTGCAPITITDAWFEDFEGYLPGSDFACWAKPIVAIGGGGGPFMWYHDNRSLSHSGYNSAEMKAQIGYTNMLLLPEFSNPLDTLRLTFWATSTNPNSTNGRLEVGVVTNGDPNTFQLVGTCGTPAPRGAANVANGNLMGPFDFNNVQAANGRIALLFYGDGSESNTLSWNLDDFTVTFIPTCPEPTSLAVVNVTTNSVAVSWNLVNGFNYDLLYWVDGTTDTVVRPNATLTNGVYTITNLSPNVHYCWTVRSNCSGEFVYAAQPVSFTTMSLPVEPNYTQDFETNPANIADFMFSGFGMNQWTIGSATNMPDGESGHAMYISDDNGASNVYTITSESNAYAVLNLHFPVASMEYHLDFDYMVEGEIYQGVTYDYLSVYLLDADANNPTAGSGSTDALLFQTVYSNGWQHYHTVLQDVAGTSKKLVFFWRNDYTGGANPPAAIDNISILGSSCAQPTDLSVSNVSMNAATLSWTENGTAQAWTLYYKAVGSTGDYQGVQVTGDPTKALTGLQTNTEYECYVVAQCSAMPSVASAHLVFRTACEAISVAQAPWIADFENALDDYLDCWASASTAVRNGRIFPRVEPTASIAHNSSAALEIAFGDIVTALPAFVEDLSSLEISFWAKLAMANANDASYNNYLEFGYITDPMVASTFVPLDTLYKTMTTYGKTVRSFADLGSLNLPSSTRIAFRYKQEDASNLTSWYVDGIQVNLIPACSAPFYTSVQISNISSSSAMVSFTDYDTTHTSWMIYYRPENSTQEYVTRGTTTMNGTLISGLAPNTTYTVFVKTVCSGTQSENQTFAVTFTTATLPAQLPLIENFENVTNMQWVMLNGNQTNKWCVGIPTDANPDVNVTENGARGLYISNNNGASNTYSYNGYGSSSRVYAYREVMVPDGTTELILSFDWKAYGRNAQEEFLRAYWLDASIPLTAGNIPPVINGVNYDDAGQPGNYGADGAPHFLARRDDWQHTEMLISANQYGDMGAGNRVYRLVFNWRDMFSINGPANPPAAVDNVVLRPMRCAAPTNVTVSDITTTSAVLSWNGNAESYALYIYGPDTLYRTVTGNTDTLSLVESSAYTVYMRALCDGDSSIITPALHFHSACNVHMVTATNPWTEDFEDYEGNHYAELMCWDTPMNATFDDVTYPVVSTNVPYASHSGSKSLELKAGNGTVIMAVLPEYNNNLRDLRLSFWATSTDQNSANGSLEVGVISNNDPSTFQLLQTAGTPIFLNVHGGAGNYMGPFDFNMATDTAGRIALRFHGDGTADDDNILSWNLDDVVVQLIPTCPSPVKTSVAFSHVGAHEANVSFVDNDTTHNSWTVFYRPTGSDVDWTPKPTNVTTVTLTGLVAETTYDVYVVTNCEILDEVADATFIYSFTTDVACRAPDNLTVDPSSYQATVVWNGDASSYTVVCEGDTQTVGSHSVVLTGLSASTEYTVYVTANCGEDGTSTAMATFTTGCGVVSHFPYTEGFESSLGCWTTETVVGNHPWFYVNNNSYDEDYSHSGVGSVALSYELGSARLISPIFNFANVANPMITFYYNLNPWHEVADTFALYYRTSAESEWVRLAGYDLPTSGYETDTLLLPNPTSTYQICFLGYGIDGNAILLDDITVFNASGAVSPTVTTNEATGVTHRSATLHGTVSNTNYITVGSRGFAWKQEGGSYQPAFSTDLDDEFSFTLTNLSPNTNYFYRAFIVVSGAMQYGEELSFTTDTMPAPCELPVNVTAAATSTESIVVNWDDNPNVGSWNLQYREQNVEDWAYATTLTNSYTINGLLPRTTYEIQVQADCGGDNESEWTASVFETTLGEGLQDHLTQSIILYPNPAKEVVNVQCTMNNGQFEVTGIEVFDVYGKLINTVDVVDNLTRINVSGLADGMYFVRVTTDQGAVTKAFVKR